MPVDSIQSSVEDKMKKSIEALKHSLGSIRTGRATPSILDRVVVDYFGTPTPVQALATISVPDPRMITIQPWDHQAMTAIEKAILKSDLGLTPNNDGQVIRLNLPSLTDDRRRELVKQTHKHLEDAKVAIRNNRREGVDALKKEEKDKAISQNDLHRGEEALQKLTDRFVAQVDDVGKDKEREIMEP
jgi:ribosome recycling factor